MISPDRAPAVERGPLPVAVNPGKRQKPDFADLGPLLYLGAGLADLWRASPQAGADLVFRPWQAGDGVRRPAGGWLWEVKPTSPEGRLPRKYFDSASHAPLAREKAGKAASPLAAAELLKKAWGRAQKMDSEVRLISAFYKGGDLRLRFGEGEFWFNSPRLKAKERYKRSYRIWINPGRPTKVRAVPTEWYYDQTAGLVVDPAPAFQKSMDSGLKEWSRANRPARLAMSLQPASNPGNRTGGPAFVWRISAGVSGQPQKTFRQMLDGTTLAVIPGKP